MPFHALRSPRIPALLLVLLPFAAGAAEPVVREVKDGLELETDQLVARVNSKGYVERDRRGHLSGQEDRGEETSASDCTSWTSCSPPAGETTVFAGPKVHGNLPKHYVEGPQICTQAKELQPGGGPRERDCVAVQTQVHVQPAGEGVQGRPPTWEQTLVFQPGRLYVLSVRKGHQRERRGRPVLPHRHAGPCQAQRRGYVRQVY